MFVIQKLGTDGVWRNIDFWCNESGCFVMHAYQALADAMIRATSMLIQEGGKFQVVKGDVVQQWVYDVA